MYELIGFLGAVAKNPVEQQRFVDDPRAYMKKLKLKKPLTTAVLSGRLSDIEKLLKREMKQLKGSLLEMAERKAEEDERKSW